jgi:hypothetical protein
VSFLKAFSFHHESSFLTTNKCTLGDPSSLSRQETFHIQQDRSGSPLPRGSKFSLVNDIDLLFIRRGKARAKENTYRWVSV